MSLIKKLHAVVPGTSTTLVGIVLYHLYKPTSHSRLAQILRVVIVYLLWVNWRAFPLKWHIDLFKWPYAARLSWPFMSLARIAPHIGQSPFDIKTRTSGCVTWDVADFNMHLSNSSYAKYIDEARFKFWVWAFGPAHAKTSNQVYGALASSSYAYYRELPVGANFEIETSIAGWDSKYIYLAARFLTKDKKGQSVEHCMTLSAYKIKTFLQPSAAAAKAKLASNSSPSPSGTATPVPQLHRKSRLTVSPGRFISMAGFGPYTNWTRFYPEIKEEQLKKMSGRDWIRLNGKTKHLWKDWILDDGDDGLGDFEDERSGREQKLKDIIGETASWKAF
ncbi:hypothetical protein BT69DRAFT_1329365 [Atractiella rhizophila]|nr:hypothetical protein BT69DRAFT_1329365 [Atractiella rhizophila]